MDKRLFCILPSILFVFGNQIDFSKPEKSYIYTLLYQRIKYSFVFVSICVFLFLIVLKKNYCLFNRSFILVLSDSKVVPKETLSVNLSLYIVVYYRTLKKKPNILYNNYKV